MATLNEAMAAAEASKRALLRMWRGSQQHIDQFWRHFADQLRAAENRPGAKTDDGMARRLGILQAAKHAMDAFAALPNSTACSLAYWHTPGAMTPDGTRVWGNMAMTNPEGLLADHPLLGLVQAEMNKAQAGRLALIEQDNAQAREDAAKQAPAALLTKLRGAGLNLSVEKGRIVCPANMPVAADDREEIVFHKDALVALLQAEADAVRPMVIA